MSPARPLRVAVANDYQIVVSGVAAVLRPHKQHVAVVELDANRDVLADVDIVLAHTFGQIHPTEIRLPELPRPDTKVIVLGFATTHETVRHWIDAGAHGFLVDPAGPRLVDAILRVHAGERIYPAVDDLPSAVDALPDGTEITKSDLDGSWPGSSEGLSPRESEVIALICQGLSNEEIAQQLFLGINTVKTYIKGAYRKAAVTTRTQAVLWGIEHGFLPDDDRTALA